MNKPESTIKPCPFCGGAAKLEEIPRGNEDMYSVECANPECKVGPVMDADCWPRSAELAVEAWNERAN